MIVENVASKESRVLSDYMGVGSMLFLREMGCAGLLYEAG